ncbi:MAG: MazG-like family protein [Clostridia bacterium]|nr:MazG-like family protein [Clostridia bacterium]
MQDKVKKFNNIEIFESQMSPFARILDIESEMGELAKEYLKSSKYGTKQFEVTYSFKEEFGDVLYALMSLGNELEINCEECLDIALTKMKERMNKTGTIGSGK